VKDSIHDEHLSMLHKFADSFHLCAMLAALHNVHDISIKFQVTNVTKMPCDVTFNEIKPPVLTNTVKSLFDGYSYMVALIHEDAKFRALFTTMLKESLAMDVVECGESIVKETITKDSAPIVRHNNYGPLDQYGKRVTQTTETIEHKSLCLTIHAKEDEEEKEETQQTLDPLPLSW
jgi:hypothetical protein